MLKEAAMKKFKVLVLCICTVFALTALLAACGPVAPAANAEPWIQTQAASVQPNPAQATGPASSAKAAGGCCN